MVAEQRPRVSVGRLVEELDRRPSSTIIPCGSTRVRDAIERMVDAAMHPHHGLTNISCITPIVIIGRGIHRGSLEP